MAFISREGSALTSFCFRKGPVLKGRPPAVAALSVSSARHGPEPHGSWWKPSSQPCLPLSPSPPVSLTTLGDQGPLLCAPAWAPQTPCAPYLLELAGKRVSPSRPRGRTDGRCRPHTVCRWKSRRSITPSRQKTNGAYVSVTSDLLTAFVPCEETIPAPKIQT